MGKENPQVKGHPHQPKLFYGRKQEDERKHSRQSSAKSKATVRTSPANPCRGIQLESNPDQERAQLSSKPTSTSSSIKPSHTQIISEDSLSVTNRLLSEPQPTEELPAHEKHGTATAISVLQLVRDVSAAFTEVPYIGFIAGVVQQIVTISEEIQSNKDKSNDLVYKVTLYSRAVFSRLLCFKTRRDLLPELREDIEELARVFQSIYAILQSMVKRTRRWQGLLYRDDIASKIAEQDKKLCVAIDVFKLKSLISIRSNKVGESKPNYYSTNTRVFRRRTRLRAKPPIILGRDQEVTVIVKALEDAFDGQGTPPHVCILGTGGIGKTTLALSVIHKKSMIRRFKEERFFVSCEAATSPELLLSEIATTLQLAENATDNILETIIDKLSQQPSLLILDNFETPWENPSCRTEIEELLAEIASLKHLGLLLTMRGCQKPGSTLWANVLPPIEPINLQAATSVFEAIAHKVDDYAIHLIKAVACIPLAITLIANLAAVHGETTEALWARWQDEGTSLVNGEDRLSSLEKSIQLSLNSPRMLLDASGMVFLSAVALLPDGVSPAFCRECKARFPALMGNEKVVQGVSSDITRAISTLRQNALIYEDAEDNIRVLNPIRLYIQTHHPPSKPLRQFIHNHFIQLAARGSSYDDPLIRAHLRREVGNIESILLTALDLSTGQQLLDLVSAIIHFSHYSYASGRGFTLTLSLAIEKLSVTKNPTFIQMSAAKQPARQVGFLNVLKARATKNVPIAVPVTRSSAEVVDPTTSLHADCLGCWGQFLMRQSQFQLAKEKFEQAKELHVAARDRTGEAYDTLNIGLAISRGNQGGAQALQMFQKAIGLHEDLGDKAGKAYDLIATAYALQDMKPEHAHEVHVKILEAAELFAEINDDAGQASALNGLGVMMLGKCRFTEAESHFTRALELSTRGGDIVGQAENIAGQAFSFLLRSRFSEAQEAIEEAISLRKPDIEPDYLIILGRIFLAKSDYDQAKGTLKQAYSAFQSTQDNHGQANSLTQLAHIALWRGENRAALDLINQAETNCSSTTSGELLKARTMLLRAELLRRDLRFDAAREIIETAIKECARLDSALEKADCLHLQAKCEIDQSALEAARMALEMALEIHVATGNLEGQADDLNKIAEVLVHQYNAEAESQENEAIRDKAALLSEATALVNEALELHTQIGHLGGQAYDLYVVSKIGLAEGRLQEAEEAVKRALIIHLHTGAVYLQEKDSNMLNEIMQRQTMQSTTLP